MAHGPQVRIAEKARPVLAVLAAEALGHQHLDLLADEVGAGVAEQRLGLGVDQDDGALPVDDDHGVGRRFEEHAETFLGRLALGDVLGRAAEADGRAQIVDDNLGVFTDEPG